MDKRKVGSEKVGGGVQTTRPKGKNQQAGKAGNKESNVVSVEEKKAKKLDKIRGIIEKIDQLEADRASMSKRLNDAIKGQRDLLHALLDEDDAQFTLRF